MISKTLSPENQFRFQCPIFQVETKIASCLALRDAVYRGDKPEVRVGCQCAIMAGKCPVPSIVTRMVREKTDPYHSAEPKVGTLEADLLDKIAPVLVTDAMMKRYPLSASEEKLIVQANEDARSGKRVIAKKPRKPDPTFIEDVPSVAPPARPTDAGERMKAAMSGDMSAAINAETGDATTDRS